MRINSFEDAVGCIFTSKYNTGTYWKVVDNRLRYVFCDIDGNPLPSNGYPKGKVLGPWDISLTNINRFLVSHSNVNYNPVFDKIKQMEQRFKDRQHA